MTSEAMSKQPSLPLCGLPVAKEQHSTSPAGPAYHRDCARSLPLAAPPGENAHVRGESM